LLNFLLHLFFFVSRTGPHIILHILFSKVLSLLAVTLVVVYTSGREKILNYIFGARSKRIKSKYQGFQYGYSCSRVSLANKRKFSKTYKKNPPEKFLRSVIAYT